MFSQTKLSRNLIGPHLL